jgi:hypothetical protein
MRPQMAGIRAEYRSLRRVSTQTTIIITIVFAVCFYPFI